MGSLVKALNKKLAAASAPFTLRFKNCGVVLDVYPSAGGTKNHGVILK